jgi:6-pyruvoyltetrahydropterin/6-carboxytetrahydropterin synthase
MTLSVTLRHNMETGHRLPHLRGKCESLHGHSWWVEVTVEAPSLTDGIVVEFGAYKQRLRAWMDEHLDHGVMLGAADPLLPTLAVAGKVYAFGEPGSLSEGLEWPTVENVAVLLARVGELCLADCVRSPGARVARVDVHETHVNAACWRS